MLLALGLGDEVAWVERVSVQNHASGRTATALAAREDALGDLQRMLKEATVDKELLGLLKSDIGELVAKLPHKLRDRVRGRSTQHCYGRGLCRFGARGHALPQRSTDSGGWIDDASR